MSGDVYAASDGPKRRRGLALARANQKLIAERTGWPDGALATCWELENRFPGWLVGWRPENTYKGFEHPAGYWAVSDGPFHEVETYAPDPERLAQRMAEGVPEHDYSVRGCAWCLAHPGTRRVRI